MAMLTGTINTNKILLPFTVQNIRWVFFVLLKCEIAHEQTQKLTE